jgi:hypothetical protein
MTVDAKYGVIVVGKCHEKLFCDLSDSSYNEWIQLPDSFFAVFGAPGKLKGSKREA